jgi:uncharacterized membrane-anchored protein YhcB (DUF1043 family)
MYTLDYILCYKEAFILGIVVGMIICILSQKFVYNKQKHKDMYGNSNRR